ncbi:hypothetical protein EYF80_054166 [Liparis tanakae]|uniref:Uncharacterized protein n=1 Tax=Liparis tanakae TaxID=230148 RepID=A0A4Z2F4I2_9TELE|nr:hypothetical protein EYF80_054166 [Liparis tanakae]
MLTRPQLHILTLKHTAASQHYKVCQNDQRRKNYSNTRGTRQQKKRLIVQPRLRAKGWSVITTDINHAAGRWARAHIPRQV